MTDHTKIGIGLEGGNAQFIFFLFMQNIILCPAQNANRPQRDLHSPIKFIIIKNIFGVSKMMEQAQPN